MKFVATTVALLATTAFAAPQGHKACPSKPKGDKWDDYKKPAPAPVEEYKKWEDWKDYSKYDYLKEYPFKGEKFTSTWNVIGTPDQVVLANGTAAPGEPTSVGYYHFGINSKTEKICWYILLKGTTGPYESPARTATHIHEAERGLGGPPRVVFPDPEPRNSGPEVDKISKGCMTGPFLTGLENDAGVDQGVGFTLGEIEADPAGYYADIHTVKFVPGVNRGQFA